MAPTRRKGPARTRPSPPNAPAATSSAPRVAEHAGAKPLRGALAGVSPEGELLVTIAGDEPRVAEHLLDLSQRAMLDAVRERAPVLVGFVGGDPDAPVVLGLLRRGVSPGAEDASRRMGDRLELRATERITLACGQAAIELTKDGRVEVRGTDVATESAGSIKLKGGTVQIN